jgi:four helix bundle protein
MKGGNIIQEKSYAFSLRILKLSVFLRNSSNDYSLAKQILRSGTSIGANVEEAIGGSSYKDFKAKLEIAYKEARETKYWLRLLKDGDILDKKLADSLLADCEEILRLIGSILNSIKQNISTMSAHKKPIPNS